jgi:RNA recognition motif-containing protein
VSAQGSQLFVGNVPWKATTGQVQALFESSGVTVEHVHLMDDPDTGRPKGWGFVTIGRSQDLDVAIKKLAGVALDGRTLIVERAKGSRKRESLS